MKSIKCITFVDSRITRSLLFECAKYWASEGEDVCFISKKVQEDMPPCLQGVNMDVQTYAEFLQITFVCIPNTAKLIDYLLNVKISAKIPKVFIIDNLTGYVDESDDGASMFALVCALIRDTVGHCSAVHKKPVYVIFSVKSLVDHMTLIRITLRPEKIWRVCKDEKYHVKEVPQDPISTVTTCLEYSLFADDTGEQLRLDSIKQMFNEDNCYYNSVVM